MKFERYEDAVKWLDAWHVRPHRPAAAVGLTRAKFLLEVLGNPHNTFRSVHVAGSTGKGSTTTMVGRILQAAGKCTGYFRSPHLESYRERVSVGEGDIDEASWIRWMNVVGAVAQRMDLGAYPNYDSGRPTVFEVLFAVAALYFTEQGVEWAAIETGMGGRLDATNTLHSDVAVITNISLEHTKILGSTVQEIAAEKAAIIKPGADAVTGARDDRAFVPILQRAVAQGVRLRRLDKDFFVSTRRRDTEHQSISLSDARGTLDVNLVLSGDFQAVNAATAFAAARALQERGISLEDRHIVAGLEQARMPGRFEMVATAPVVLLDGAHNPAAMRELRHSLRSFFPEKRVVLLFAAMTDKDTAAMAAEIDSYVDSVVTTTTPDTDRAASAQRLSALFSNEGGRVQAIDDPAHALAAARANTQHEDVLVVAGSLYLVGWARTRLATSGVGR